MIDILSSSNEICESQQGCELQQNNMNNIKPGIMKIVIGLIAAIKEVSHTNKIYHLKVIFKNKNILVTLARLILYYRIKEDFKVLMLLILKFSCCRF